MRDRHPWVRIGCCGALAIVFLGTSGCVYWRLSRLRRQLGEFAKYFTVEASPGPTITFLKPVLETGDIAWLLDLPPGEVTVEGDTEHHLWTLQKRGGAGAELAELGRIVIEVQVAEGRIRSVALPERFNSMIDQEILEKSFLDSDRGPVDRQGHETGWQLSSDLGIPNEEKLTSVLGSPGERTETSTHRVVDYAYDVLREGLEPGEGPADATGRFMFSRDSGRLVSADARFGALTVRVTSQEGRKYRASIRRDMTP